MGLPFDAKEPKVVCCLCKAGSNSGARHWAGAIHEGLEKERDTQEIGQRSNEQPVR